MRLGDGHKPSPNCAGAMFCSQHGCRRPLLNTNNGQLSQFWFSTDAKQVERHHFLCLPFAARKSHASSTFSTFRFLILNHMASNRSMLPHSYEIKTPVVARYGPPKPPEHLFTSGFLHRCSYVAVARYSIYGEKMLGNPWHPAEPRRSLQTRQYAMEPMDCGQWTI